MNRPFFRALGIAVCFGALSFNLRAQSFQENFDESGSSMSNAFFSDVPPNAGWTFERVSLTGVSGAPNFNPALPVNQGGDLELRVFDQSVNSPGDPARAFTADVPANYLADAQMDGYLGFGVGTGFGSRSAGFMLRATSPSDYWLAYVGANENLTGGANFRLAHVQDFLIGTTILPISIPNFDPLNENYHLNFQVVGNNLTATLGRVQIVGGVVTETLIGTLSGTDPTPQGGRAGIYAFTRGDNSILFDDLSVMVMVPEPSSLMQMALAIGSAAVWLVRRRRVEMGLQLHISR